MQETKTCQFCGEEILATAKKCKHCGEWVDNVNSKEDYDKNKKAQISLIVFAILIIINFTTNCPFIVGLAIAFVITIVLNNLYNLK